jgi:hypothetical protein
MITQRSTFYYDKREVIHELPSRYKIIIMSKKNQIELSKKEIISYSTIHKSIKKCFLLLSGTKIKDCSMQLNINPNTKNLFINKLRSSWKMFNS